MRTPLGRVLGLGSAKEGTDHFWQQRLTSIANIPLVIFFIWLIVSLNGESYETVVATLSSPLIAVTLVLAIVSVTMHMRMGMQVVIEDYAEPEIFKLILIVLNTFFTIAVAALSIFAILKLGFGG